MNITDYRRHLCYNPLAMIDTFLVADKTVVNAKGDGPAVDIGGAANRVFLLTLDITNIIEQESFELSILVRRMEHPGK